METEKKYPYKLEIGVWMNERTYPIWVYNKVPDGMRQITSLRELWYGRSFLYPGQLPCSKGEYLTDYMRDTVVKAVKYMFDTGVPIYVKD